MTWNMLAKRVPGKEYLIRDFMATTMSKAKFEKLKEINPKTLGEYSFIPHSETDFSWWSRCTKKLTPTKIIRAEFDIDYYGNVKEY